MGQKDIIEKLKIFRSNAGKRYPISSMALFGSVAREEDGLKSDIDIVVDFNGRIGSDFIRLADELEEFLGRKVDLVSKNGIKEKYYKSIEPDLIYV